MRDQAFVYRFFKGRQGRLWWLYPLILWTPAAAAALCAGYHRSEEGPWVWALNVAVFGQLLYVCWRGLSGSLQVIGKDRALGNWDVLLTSRMKVWEIYAGTVGSVLLPLIVPVAVLLPTLAVYGVQPQTLLKLWLFTLTMACFWTVLGTWAALSRPTSRDAGQIAYWTMALLGVAPILGWIALDLGLKGFDFDYNWNHHVLVTWLCSLNPIFTLSGLLYPGSDTPHANFMGSFLGYALGAVTLAVLGIRAISRPPQPGRGRPRAVLAGPREALAYRRYCTRSRWSWMPRLLACSLMAGPWLAGLDPYRSLTMVAFSGLVYLLARAGGLSVGCLASERERQTLDSLVGTRLTAHDQFRGYGFGIAAELGLDLGLLGLGLAFYAWPCQNGAVLLVELLAAWSSSALFFSLLGLWFSSRETSTLKAGQKLFFWMAAACLGSFWIDMILSQLMGYGDFFVCLRANPVVAVLVFTEPSPGAGRGMGLGCIALYLVGSLWLAWRTLANLRQLYRL